MSTGTIPFQNSENAKKNNRFAVLDLVKLWASERGLHNPGFGMGMKKRNLIELSP